MHVIIRFIYLSRCFTYHGIVYIKLELNQASSVILYVLSVCQTCIDLKHNFEVKRIMLSRQANNDIIIAK